MNVPNEPGNPSPVETKYLPKMPVLKNRLVLVTLITTYICLIQFSNNLQVES